MIHIHIHNIKINSISTIGSLNIGKAVLCHNRSSFTAMPKRGSAVPTVEHKAEQVTNEEGQEGFEFTNANKEEEA